VETAPPYPCRPREPSLCRNPLPVGREKAALCTGNLPQITAPLSPEGMQQWSTSTSATRVRGGLHHGSSEDRIDTKDGRRSVDQSSSAGVSSGIAEGIA